MKNQPKLEKHKTKTSIMMTLRSIIKPEKRPIQKYHFQILLPKVKIHPIEIIQKQRDYKTKIIITIKKKCKILKNLIKRKNPPKSEVFLYYFF